MAFLILEYLNGERDHFTLRGERTTLGRDVENHISIDNEYVSAFHAEFRSKPDGNIELADLNSHNGTEVNGKRIEEPFLLKNGDVLRFGLLRSFYYQAAEETQPSRDREGSSSFEEAFLPGVVHANPLPVHAPSSRGTNESNDGLTGAVLSFEEFDFAPVGQPRRTSSLPGRQATAVTGTSPSREEIIPEGSL